MGQGATVSVYVEAPLCRGAEAELARRGGRAGGLHVRALCVPSGRRAGGLDLATLGADARRATEDSTAIAYVAAPGPPVARFTLPILESAGIPQLTDPSGAAAMRHLLAAIEKAPRSGSLRAGVKQQLISSPPLR